VSGCTLNVVLHIYNKKIFTQSVRLRAQVERAHSFPKSETHFPIFAEIFSHFQNRRFGKELQKIRGLIANNGSKEAPFCQYSRLFPIFMGNRAETSPLRTASRTTTLFANAREPLAAKAANPLYFRQLDGHRCCFAPADAQAGNTALQTARFQRADKGREDAGA